jgi:hypothetical protein
MRPGPPPAPDRVRTAGWTAWPGPWGPRGARRGAPRAPRREGFEQPDQAQPGLVALLARGPPDRVEQPAEADVDPAGGHLDVGRAALCLRVVRVVLGVAERLGLVVGVDPPDQIHLREPHRGRRMTGLGTKHLLEGRRRAVQITALHGLLGLGEAGVAEHIPRPARSHRARPRATAPARPRPGRSARSARSARSGRSARSRPGRPARSGLYLGAAGLPVGAAGHGVLTRQSEPLGDLHDLPQPLHDVRLGQCAEEPVHHLAGHHGHDHRDGLHLERRAQLRVSVHVDLGQHPGAIGLVGQLLQHRRKLLAGPAPFGPQIEDHRNAARPVDHVRVEGLVGHVDDVARRCARLVTRGRGLGRSLPALRSGLQCAQVYGAVKRGEIPRRLHASILPHTLLALRRRDAGPAELPSSLGARSSLLPRQSSRRRVPLARSRSRRRSRRTARMTGRAAK